jgi:hypothetical protein
MKYSPFYRYFPKAACPILIAKEPIFKAKAIKVSRDPYVVCAVFFKKVHPPLTIPPYRFQPRA